MKSNILIIAYYTSIAAILTFSLVSCGEMDEPYREFVERGETIYTAKADSLKVRAGKNRIELSFLLLSDPKIAKYKVYWNNGRDSVENRVEKSAGVDTVRLMLNNMEEGTHQFEIYTYDEVGNTSVKAIKLGKVYGDRYESSLLPATYAKLARSGNDLEILWAEPNEDLAGIDLSYSDNMNVTREIHIDRNEELTILSEFPKGGEFKFKTSFLPEPQALDTFYTDYSKVNISTDTLQWNNYPVLFGHFGSLIAMQEDAQLMQLDQDDTGGFKSPRKISRGWHAFDIFFSHHGTGGVIARFPDGGLRRYALNADGTFGTTKTIGSGFHIFDPFFSYGNNLMGRKDNGDLWKYPLDDNGDFGTASLVPGTWDQYDKLLGSDNAIIGRTPDGKLWHIPMDRNGDFGAAVEIGDDWHRFDLIANYGNDLMAREPGGELWHYSINEDGSLGTPKQIIVVTERL